MLKVGQVWKDRKGRLVTIELNDDSGVFKTVSGWEFKSVGEGFSYRNDGTFGIGRSDRDLIELVKDVEPTEGEKGGEDLPDGWIAWSGGECPVNEAAGVFVKYRNGSTRSSYLASQAFRWSHNGGPCDITAYFVVPSQPLLDNSCNACDDGCAGGKCKAEDPKPERKHSHYFKDVSRLDVIDVYRVCDLFGVDDPSGATQHAVKKLLCAGQRGAKDRAKDYQEAIDTLTRRIEMMGEA